MNRKERRKLEKSQKGMFKFIRRNVEGIFDVLNTTEDLIEKASKNIEQVTLPKNFEERIQECIKRIEQFNKLLPSIREMFLFDKNNSNGFIRKSIVNALSIPKYKEKLKEVVATTISNQNNGVSGTFDYIMWHDLSANRTEVKRTLDVLENALPVIITNLKTNNIKRIDYLIQQVTILERRLYQLHCLYGYYLEDIDDFSDYFIISKAFQEIDFAIQNSYDIRKNMNYL